MKTIWMKRVPTFNGILVTAVQFVDRHNHLYRTTVLIYLSTDLNVTSLAKKLLTQEREWTRENIYKINVHSGESTSWQEFG